jgi:hypothetical protein
VQQRQLGRDGDEPGQYEGRKCACAPVTMHGVRGFKSRRLAPRGTERQRARRSPHGNMQ